MSTAKTVILLNRVPGPWIQIKRELRKGDPLSPLLFLVVVDALQQIIKRFSREGHLLHPIIDDTPCPIIQYANDTLILIQGCPDQARLLKEILDTFSASIGLAINYDKSTFLPLNLDPDEQSLISNILDCHIAAFPQTYLGLPLSNSKLPRRALSPILPSFDNRVDTLSTKGASSRGRLTLTKSILSAISAHFLARIKAPKWFYKEVDSRRGYFWIGSSATTGGHCKIAWDVVCRSTDEGGLNIKNLEIQNICLLLKFIHKLHTLNNCSWAKWIRSSVYRGNKRLRDKIYVCSNSWRYHLYRDLTVVQVGNGRHTSFWLDSWIGNKPLSIQFPALFSHVQHPNMTIAKSFTELGWQLRFCHITSQRVKNELTSLMNLINDITLTEEADVRTMRFGPHKNKFSQGMLLCHEFRRGYCLR
jgi:hypothetical protein